MNESQNSKLHDILHVVQLVTMCIARVLRYVCRCSVSTNHDGDVDPSHGKEDTYD